jgi:prophage maintenance system killer protein
VAAAITEAFLETNGSQLIMTEDEIIQLFLDIASGLSTRDHVEKLLRERVSPKS